MIWEYQLTNFKAFFGPETIPIRPITLIYGPNSSGKSSIIQSLLMLKQTLEQAEDIETLLLPKGSFVNLGNYQEFIYRHESDRLFSFQTAFNMDSSQVSDNLKELLNVEDKLFIGIKIVFRFDNENTKIRFESINYFVGDLEDFCVSYKSSQDFTGLIVDQLNSDHPLWQSWWKRIEPTIQKLFSQILKKYFKALDLSTFPRSKQKIIDTLQESKNDLDNQLESLYLQEKSSNQNLKSEIEPLEDKLSLVEALIKISTKLRSYKFEDALNDFTQLSQQYYAIYCNHFIPQDIEPDFPEILEPYLNYLAEVYQNVEYSNILSDLTQDTHNIFRDFIGKLFYLGPFRNYPERFYIFSDHSDRQVGQSGKMMTDILFKNRDLLEQVNQKFVQFKINYQLKCVSFDSNDENLRSDVYTIRLVDQNNVNISLLDVGFGISQVLPVITQSMVSEKQTILIEQPELHLHPKLQTELGDLFIESALGDRKNTFVIETHSEHLMLRIMRRMRETFEDSLPSYIPKIKPEDVCVLFVEPNGENSIVREMELNSRGEFVKSWPGGFFEEELDELF